MFNRIKWKANGAPLNWEANEVVPSANSIESASGSRGFWGSKTSLLCPSLIGRIGGHSERNDKRGCQDPIKDDREKFNLSVKFSAVR